MTTTEAAIRLVLIAVGVTATAVAMGLLIGRIRDIWRQMMDLID